MFTLLSSDAKPYISSYLHLYPYKCLHILHLLKYGTYNGISGKKWLHKKTKTVLRTKNKNKTTTKNENQHNNPCLTWYSNQDVYHCSQNIIKQWPYRLAKLSQQSFSPLIFTLNIGIPVVIFGSSSY